MFTKGHDWEDELFGHLIKLFGDSEIWQYIGFDTFTDYTEQDLKNIDL